MHLKQRLSREFHKIYSSNTLWGICLLAYGILVVIATLTPRVSSLKEPSTIIGTLAGVNKISGWPEILINVCLLIPLPLLLRKVYILTRAQITIGMIIVSSTLEISQIFIPGRVASGRDVFLNVLGAIYFVWK